MSDITPSEELADLLNLRVGKILRSDEDYQEMYQRRVTRLEAMRAGTSGMSTLVERAISVTRSSHALADKLAAEMCQTEALTAATASQRVERLLAWDDRVIRMQARTAPASVTEALDRLRSKAYDFMRWTVSPRAVADNRSVRDALEDHFRAEREEDRALITTVVTCLLMAQQSRDNQLQVLRSVAQLGQLYRGLLYAGVMNTTGSSLERKQFATHLRAIGTELAGNIIPGLGLLIALAELLNLSEPDRPLAAVESARLVEEYLTKYITAVDQWMTVAEPVLKSLTQIRQAIDAV